jgi:hypothetical protein
MSGISRGTDLKSDLGPPSHKDAAVGLLAAALAGTYCLWIAAYCVDQCPRMSVSAMALPNHFRHPGLRVSDSCDCTCKANQGPNASGRYSSFSRSHSQGHRYQQVFPSSDVACPFSRLQTESRRSIAFSPNQSWLSVLFGSVLRLAEQVTTQRGAPGLGALIRQT